MTLLICLFLKLMYLRGSKVLLRGPSEVSARRRKEEDYAEFVQIS